MAQVLALVRNGEELRGVLDAIAAPDVETKPVTPQDWEAIARLREKFGVRG